MLPRGRFLPADELAVRNCWVLAHSLECDFARPPGAAIPRERFRPIRSRPLAARGDTPVVIFARHSKRSAARRLRRRVPQKRPLEVLEPRRLLSISVAATEPRFDLSEDHVLTVTGTAGADVIRVAPNGDGDSIDIAVNDLTRSFTRAGV